MTAGRTERALRTADPGPGPTDVDASRTALVRRARAMNRALQATYPDAHTELDFGTPFQLLVATILSAQSTDKRVNQVTPTLFARYPDPAAMTAADRAEMEELIKPTGFFRAKTDTLIKLGAALIERYDGEVPGTLAALVTLPGVGRKTANVVMNVAFGEATIAVDTHIFRVGNRTGLARGKTPLAVEKKLDKATPAPFRVHAHHWLILLGRYICKARTPECWRCPVADLCAYKPKTPAPRAPKAKGATAHA